MIDVSENETDSTFLKRRKRVVLKKYSPTKSKSLEEANELAVYIYATDRAEEAEQLLDSYSEKSPWENPRYERWHAACYAMLFSAYFKKKKGNFVEHRRLVSIAQNIYFDPIPWIGPNDFDEFVIGIRSGLDDYDDISHYEHSQVRSQGFLLLLYADYILGEKWPTFASRRREIEMERASELAKLKMLVE